MPCPPHICNFKIPIHTSDQKQTSFLCDTLSTLQHIFQSCVRYPFGTCPGGSEVKVSACNAGDLGSIPGSRRSPGEGNSNPFQYSCLENPMDRGAWWATVHGVAKSRTWLSNFTLAPLSWLISTILMICFCLFVSRHIISCLKLKLLFLFYSSTVKLYTWHRICSY